MTVDEVEAEVAATMRTLKHMPGDGPRDPGCAWPDVFHDRNEAYGWQPATVNHIPPTNEAITRMDVCLGYLRRLPPDERVVVSGRAAGASWRAIMRRRRKQAKSHGSHKDVYRRGLWRIVEWMNVT